MELTDSTHKLWFEQTPAYKMYKAQSLDDAVDEIIAEEKGECND